MKQKKQFHCTLVHQNIDYVRRVFLKINKKNHPHKWGNRNLEGKNSNFYTTVEESYVKPLDICGDYEALDIYSPTLNC